MGSMALGLFFGSALVRGLYRHFVDLFGLHGVVQRWWYKGRPYNKAEQVITTIIADILADPDGWEVIKKSEYDESLSLKKGNIIIRQCNMPKWSVDDFYGYSGPRIRIGKVEDYTMKNVRGDLLKELYLTIDNLRSDRVCHMLLDVTSDRKFLDHG